MITEYNAVASIHCSFLLRYFMTTGFAPVGNNNDDINTTSNNNFDENHCVTMASWLLADGC